MPSEIAIAIAAECWCQKETEDREMDVALATEFAKCVEKLLDSMEVAWGLIANAYGGDWDTASPKWKAAAKRWRDEHWHGTLDCGANTDETVETL